MFKFCDVIKKSSLFKDYNQCKTNKNLKIQWLEDFSP